MGGGDDYFGTDDGGSRPEGLGRYSGINTVEPSTSNSIPIDSSNIGFQLLKKHGWKEGTGLGISEQGRLEPVQAHVKTNKRGLGADKVKKVKKKSEDPENPVDENSEKSQLKRKSKGISKKIRKMQEFEKRLKEKEFERAFFREFWPDNV